MEKALAAINSWGIELDKSKTELLKLYAREVLEKNRNFNLTSVRSVSEIWRRHICDGLACVPALKNLLAGNSSPKIADVGCGCGYLGISVKIAWPRAGVVLWESNYKKFQFLNWIIVRLGLKGIKAVWGRLGDKPITRSDRVDMVIERAMGKLPDILQDCLNLANENGGRFAAWQSSAPGLCPKSLRIFKRSRAFPEKTIKYTLPNEKKERVILIFRKKGGGGDVV